MPLPTLSSNSKLTFAEKYFAIPNFNLVNEADLNKVLKAEVFVYRDGQLRAAHLILGYNPISTSFQVPQVDPNDKKKKRYQKGKEVVEEGRGLPSKEFEPQKGAKAAKTAHTRSVRQSLSLEPSPSAGWSPLPTNASIRDIQQRKVGYVANALEQANLLPGDMADLKSMKKHEVFLSLKRDLALAVQATHKAKELVNSSHRQMKNEERRCIMAVDAFNVAVKRI
ncbi:hypothetical protein SO802_005907 [Lithocarpus litseifolius]|uniref:Uncharacterized protein n=1 Tax=Lithocarpus litseifolius TaxID=425828 RepID=A0AAW2DKV9_9ROSI